MDHGIQIGSEYRASLVKLYFDAYIMFIHHDAVKSFSRQ
jgi:hypothetical protein